MRYAQFYALAIFFMYMIFFFLYHLEMARQYESNQ